MALLSLAILLVPPSTIAVAPAPSTAVLDGTPSMPAGPGSVIPRSLEAWSGGAYGDAAGALADLALAGWGTSQLAQRGDSSGLPPGLQDLTAAQSEARRAFLANAEPGSTEEPLERISDLASISLGEGPPLQAADALTADLGAPSPPLDRVGSTRAEVQGYRDRVAELHEPELPVADEVERLLSHQTVPPPSSPVPARPSYTSLPAAVEALIAREDVEVTEEQTERIERLGELPDPQETALTRIVEAHLLTDAAAEAAIPPDALTHAGAQEEEDRRVVDTGLLAEARDRALDHILAPRTLDGFEEGPPTPAKSSHLEVCGVIGLDLGGTNTTWTCDVALLIDVSGNDTYENNAGGAISDVAFGGTSAATLLDLEGSDSYNSTSNRTGGINGGGAFGSGMLLDLGTTRDWYVPRNPNGALNGGTFSGSGFLLDAGGNDIYNATVPNPAAVNGGADIGLAALVDLGGHDVYHGDVGAGEVNGGAGLGSGLIADTGGNDSYRARIRGGGAANGGARIGATAAIFDLGGEDVYQARVDGLGAANGGARGAHALLLDASGRDVYDARMRLDGATTGGVQGSGTAALVDLGTANDTYTSKTARIGALHGAATHGGMATLVDGGGDDTYEATIGGLGAANGATLASEAAALVDLAGNDTYDATTAREGAVNGGAHTFGQSLLLDGGGSDLYRGRTNHTGAINGGGFDGREGTTGALVDLAGNDTYEGSSNRSAAINGAGGALGEGFLLDGGGSDHYLGTGREDAAVNGAANQGAGALVDLARANDTYEGSVGESGGVNGASTQGLGVLVDAGGGDVYDGSVGRDGGANGATLIGTGILLDLGGDDTYQGAGGRNNAANGAAVLGGLGVLHDTQGNDTYDGTVRVGALNGAATIGTGVLLDGGGENAFRGAVAERGAVSGAAGGLLLFPIQFSERQITQIPAPGGLGLLVAGPGNDTYRSNGTTQGAGDLYGAGVLVDRGGDNTYVAGPGGIGQGAGRNVGAGTLVDHGDDVSMTLLNGTRGQGAGLQGVGVLARSNPHGTTLYANASLALPSVSAGSGIGLHVDRGQALLPPGFEKSLACHDPPLAEADLFVTASASGEPTGPTGVQRVGQARVCPPSNASAEPIRDPGTGEPVAFDPFRTTPPGTVWKPALPVDTACGTAPEARAPTDGTEVDGLRDWASQDHVHPTTSGWLQLLAFHDAKSSPAPPAPLNLSSDPPDISGLVPNQNATYQATMEIPLADGACKVSCGAAP